MINKSLLYLLALAVLAVAAHPESKLYFTDYCKFYNYPV